MKVKVLARTYEVDELGLPILENAKVLNDDYMYQFGGKMAGICYMPEDYFDSKIQNKERALKRADMTSKSGHHSVFDHTFISLQFSNIPKILAMLLNSTEQYTTSEKSARYTVMKPETQLELDIYNKWVEKFEQRIISIYADKIDSKTVRKLAMENARYLISVFTPTYLAWTTSFRQLAYIICWLERLIASLEGLDGQFNIRLKESCQELYTELKKVTTSYKYIVDNKDRDFEFAPYQLKREQNTMQDVIGDVYQVTYTMSFAALAQAQRHRTIHYEFDFIGAETNQYGVYIPPIIRGTELEQEYKDDFNKVSYCYPEGTLVKVLEQGRAVKFFEKCKERLCGRAQLEIMQNCMETMQRFIDNQSSLSDRTKVALRKVTIYNELSGDYKLATKCQMCNINCKEPCIWGASEAFTRII